MMRKAFALVLAGFAVTAADAAPPPPFDESVGDPALSLMRGGFRLPNGIDVSLAVQSDTLVNGAVVLRSVFTANQGPAALQVFVARPGEPMQGGAQSASGSGPAMPSISFDPQKGLVVIPASTAPRVSINSGGAGLTADPGAGLQQVAISSGGSVATADGRVSVLPLDFGGRVRFETAGLDTSHFYGSAYGSLTANTGSDRSIDTVTTISLDLGNIGPDVLGSSLLRAEGLALEATTMLNRGG